MFRPFWVGFPYSTTCWCDLGGLVAIKIAWNDVWVFFLTLKTNKVKFHLGSIRSKSWRCAKTLYRLFVAGLWKKTLQVVKTGSEKS